MSRKVKVEAVYLMSIIPHFISLNMLMRFHQVSKSCDDAISRLKINPCYQELSLETILQNDHSVHIKKEIQIFTGIDTLHTDIQTLQQLPEEYLVNVKLFELSFIQKQNPTTFPVWGTIKNRVSRMSMDANFVSTFDFLSVPNLRRLELRAGRVLFNVELPIRKMESLNTLIILCDGSLYQQYYKMFEQFVCSRLRVIYKLNWLQQQDFDDILTLTPNNIVGVYLNELPPLLDNYLSTKISLLYYSKKEFRIPIELFLDKNLSLLLKLYHPSVIDVRGEVDNDEGGTIDLHEETQLEELCFNFVVCKTKISIILPKSLKKLVIHKDQFLCNGGLLQLGNTQVPKECYTQYGDAVQK
ncbi:Leucine-rich repeat containing protein [Entamoeba marina]